jgi:hypothetical protein
VAIARLAVEQYLIVYPVLINFTFLPQAAMQFVLQAILG